MRPLTQGIAITAAMILGALSSITSLNATPGPHREEWWFSSWSIQNSVWPITKGKGVTVAVIDTGVRADLPELKKVVVPGADFKNAASDGRTDTDRDWGHGTGMAALIAGQGGPSGWLGIAPESKIMPIVPGGMDGQARAIRLAADQSAKVINISLATPNPFTPCPLPIQKAVAYAAEKDVVVVAGAGNDGDGVNSPNWPAACAGVLAVGGVDSRGEPWVKTQRQDYVSVAAPGVGVGTIGKDGKLGHYGAGTSQATALTSGAAALIRSRYPEMPAREVVQRLIGTALDVGPKGKDDQTGYGVIRIPRALTQEVPKSTPNPPYERLDQWLASGRTAGPTFTPQPGGGGPLIKGWYIAVGAVVLVLAVIAAIVAVVVVRQRGGRGAAANPAPHSWQDVPPPPYGQPGAPPPPYGQQGTHPRPHGRQSESPPPNGEEGVPPGSGQDAPGAD